ncbi:MAG: CAP domain-containing protein [Thermosynechococcaceae cyanobacterium]
MTLLLGDLQTPLPLTRSVAPAQVLAFSPRQGVRNYQQIALALANRDRARYGRSPVQADRLLTQAAQRHAEDMLQRNYFSHYTPEGRTPSDRFAAVGGQGGAAENIAMLDAPYRAQADIASQKLPYFERMWMNSPGHRANLLNGQYGRFGFGVAASRDRIYVVQMFR